MGDQPTSPSETSSTTARRLRELTLSPSRKWPPSPSCATTQLSTSTTSREFSRRSERPPRLPSSLLERRSTPTLLLSPEAAWSPPSVSGRTLRASGKRITPLSSPETGSPCPLTAPPRSPLVLETDPSFSSREPLRESSTDAHTSESEQRRSP